MTSSTPDQTPAAAPVEIALPLDPQDVELQKQVQAHVREFGPRKYLAIYNKAKELKAGGLDPASVRMNLITALPQPVTAPEGGVHFISMVHGAKLKAMNQVAIQAVDDALARRPPQFREDLVTAAKP
jgi:hypothetical protein